MAPAQPWRSLLCCVGGAAAGDDEGPSPSSAPARRRGDRRALLLPSSEASSASRVSLSSLGSTGALTPEDLSLTLSGSNLHAFTYAELRAATAGFSRSRFLGCGGFGPVYRGQLAAELRPGLDAQTVAVKYLDADSSSQGHNEWLVSLSLPTHYTIVTDRLHHCCSIVASIIAPTNFSTSLIDSAGGGVLPWATEAQEPGEAGRLLLRGGAPDAGVRVHGRRQPGEAPLQKHRRPHAVDDEDEDSRRRRQGPRLPPRRRHARHLPRPQGLQHPARLG
uniref:Predicted protein n=1 Tax=Hordeum vulgare subsp. vulgare TaxID=112509 RepID=F2DJ61_HORVV|nr:predicted protein [Hordeum vulgare subsp. vulgare]